MGGYLITGGRLLDGTGAAPQDGVSVLVEGNRIRKIGLDREVAAAAETLGGYRTIDAAGRTVMPGMIDGHCHISYGDILSFEELDLYAGVEYRTLRAANNARKVLRAGVTAFSDPGSTWNISVAVRDAVNAGLIEGPRMASAGRYITTYNAIGSPWPSWMEHPKSSFAVLCNTRDEMVTEARREIKDGVDIVKVAGDGDVLTGEAELAGSIGLDDLRAIAEVTHRLGKVCTIHARSGRAAADAIRAGFDWIIHGSYMSDEDLGVLFRNPTPLIPTFSLLVNTLDWGPDLGCSDFVLDAYKDEVEHLAAVVARARAEEITIIAGTDSGQGSVPYGEWARPRDGAPDDLRGLERHGGDPRGHRQRSADTGLRGRDRHAGGRQARRPPGGERRPARRHRRASGQEPARCRDEGRRSGRYRGADPRARTLQLGKAYALLAGFADADPELRPRARDQQAALDAAGAPSRRGRVGSSPSSKRCRFARKCFRTLSVAAAAACRESAARTADRFAACRNVAEGKRLPQGPRTMVRCTASAACASIAPCSARLSRQPRADAGRTGPRR